VQTWAFWLERKKSLDYLSNGPAGLITVDIKIKVKSPTLDYLRLLVS